MLFDKDNPTTHPPALYGVDRVYLVTPVMRVRYAGLVSDFLDLAAGTGVRHVTYLSTYGSDQAPPEVDIRAVELDLAARGAFTRSRSRRWSTLTPMPARNTRRPALSRSRSARSPASSPT